MCHNIIISFSVYLYIFKNLNKIGKNRVWRNLQSTDVYNICVDLNYLFKFWLIWLLKKKHLGSMNFGCSEFREFLQMFNFVLSQQHHT